LERDRKKTKKEAKKKSRQLTLRSICPLISEYEKIGLRKGTDLKVKTNKKDS